MSLYTRLTDLPVTGGSHVSHAILLDRSRPIKHFWARARIELWRGVRDRFSTVSTTVHQSLNAVARGKSGIMLQHDHRSQSLCNRIYYGAGTHVPLHTHARVACAAALPIALSQLVLTVDAGQLPSPPPTSETDTQVKMGTRARLWPLRAHRRHGG